MDVAPRYLGQNSFLARRDPRVLIVVPALTVVVATQLHDPREMIIMALLAFGFYLLARIPFAAVRRNWAFVAFFVLITAGLNGLVFGAGADSAVDDSPVLGAIPVVGIPITVKSISYASTLLLRFLAIAMTGFPLAFCVRPGDLAVGFARLGLPARFAYGIDLTFRFLPSAAASLRDTQEAQRLRGYQPPPTYNPIRKLLNVRPLMIPLTVNSLIDAEEVADALDLRGFGSSKRSWLRTLRMQPADWLVLGFFVGLAVAATVINITRVALLPPLW